MSDFTLECGSQRKNSKENSGSSPFGPMFRRFCEERVRFNSIIGGGCSGFLISIRSWPVAKNAVNFFQET